MQGRKGRIAAARVPAYATAVEYPLSVTFPDWGDGSRRQDSTAAMGDSPHSVRKVHLCNAWLLRFHGRELVLLERRARVS